MFSRCLKLCIPKQILLNPTETKDFLQTILRPKPQDQPHLTLWGGLSFGLGIALFVFWLFLRHRRLRRLRRDSIHLPLIS